MGTDNVEFAALCAPRPMILVGATGDWTAKTMTRAFPAIRGVYSLIGSTDRVEAAVFDFPHNYNQTSRNAVYAFMGRWLLGIDDPSSTREGQQQTEKPEDLWTFDPAIRRAESQDARTARDRSGQAAWGPQKINRYKRGRRRYDTRMSKAEELERKYALLFPHLNERQQHLIAAFDGQRLGRGGITIVSRVTGFSRPTIYRAIESLSQRPLPVERVRHSGAGRKTLVHHDPQLVQALEALVDPDTRGDPMSPLRWTCKSTRVLARLLTAQGHPVSYMTVAQLLHDLHYSLQGNAKTKEGKQHPDRDAQFRYIQRQGESFLSRGWPVISVDTKKKELIGNYEKSGQEWQPEGQPIEVDVHDFPDPDIPKAVPRGVYDQQRNEGWVTVGCSHDTSSFAVESIRRWWREMGHPLYPEAEEVLVCADSGGSNGYRLRLWKVELQHWANEAGLDVTVCHYPPGTSKWNKIEHRLFSEITKNWRGRPLESYQVVVNLIGATTTETGLRVRADFDREFYPTKVKVTDTELATVDLHPHHFHGEWNYTIKHYN